MEQQVDDRLKSKWSDESSNDRSTGILRWMTGRKNDEVMKEAVAEAPNIRVMLMMKC